MNTTSNGVRALSSDECDDISGGVGWFVAIAVWAASAGVGAGLAILTYKEEEVLVPKLDLPD